MIARINSASRSIIAPGLSIEVGHISRRIDLVSVFMDQVKKKWLGEVEELVNIA